MSEIAPRNTLDRLLLGQKPLPREVDLQKVLAVDPSKLTEVERIALVSSVRDALDAISNTKRPSTDLLAKKIRLLRLWCVLVKLRVEAVRAEAPPPEHQPVTNRRGKSNAKLKISSRRQEASAKRAEEIVEEAPPAPVSESGLIELRLLEAGLVRGVMLPAGITIAVEPHDAAELLESNMAMRTK